jgi:hypothetical protein
MQLKHTTIPLRFLDQLPEGIKFIHKQDKEFLVVEELTCPNNHSLMAPSVCIHGEPSVMMKVRLGGIEGLLFVDAFWGSHAKLFSFIPRLSEEHPLVEAFCPTCGVSLLTDEACSLPECECQKSILFHLPGAKNRILVCARLGCPGHLMDISDLPHRLSESVSEINYFGAAVDDFFEGI